MPNRSRLAPALIAATVTAFSAAASLDAHPGHEHDEPHSPSKPRIATVVLAGETEPEVTITVRDGFRLISANGLPNHETGRFPNRGNPNSIRPQRYDFKVPAEPQVAAQRAFVGGWLFGIGINGVPFDPLTAEFFRGDRSSPWRYEAISPTLSLGLDDSRAHVQPSGAYHYHGVPDGLVERLAGASRARPVLLGYAADGFPIYTADAYAADGAPTQPANKPYRSSYRLRAGARPVGPGSPGGNYDGTFTADFEYIAGSGELDESNGRTGPTPEFPKGTYYYAITAEFPFVPRSFRGVPDASFAHGPRRGPPPGFRPPPRPVF